MTAARQLPGRGPSNVDGAHESCMYIKNLIMIIRMMVLAFPFNLTKTINQSSGGKKIKSYFCRTGSK